VKLHASVIRFAMPMNRLGHDGALNAAGYSRDFAGIFQAAPENLASLFPDGSAS